MSGFTVKVEGLSAIEAALQELPKATAKTVMRRVLTKLAEPIAQTAASLAPVETGDLSKSIGVSTKLTRNAKRARGRIPSGAVEIYIGPFAAPRSITQEFGTIFHPPHPFMRPAWDQHREDLLPKVADMMWAEISAAAERKAKKEARQRYLAEYGSD